MQHLYLNFSYSSTLRKLQQDLRNPRGVLFAILSHISLSSSHMIKNLQYLLLIRVFLFLFNKYAWRYFIFSCVLNYCKLQYCCFKYCCFKENKHHLNPWYLKKKTSKDINCMNILGHTLIVFFIFIFSWGELIKGLGSMLPFACRGPR